jgi:hypothetical protein
MVKHLLYFKINFMFKVKEKFKKSFVTCDKFTVNLSEASQDQLEHLFHIGHIGIESIGKRPKNKSIDNIMAETDKDINE